MAHAENESNYTQEYINALIVRKKACYVFDIVNEQYAKRHINDDVYLLARDTYDTSDLVFEAAFAIRYGNPTSEDLKFSESMKTLALAGELFSKYKQQFKNDLITKIEYCDFHQDFLVAQETYHNSKSQNYKNFRL